MYMLFADNILEENAQTQDPDNHMVVLSNIGLITVKAYRARTMVPNLGKRVHSFRRRAVVQQPIPEKMLKGQSLTHRTRFSEPEEISIANGVQCDYLDPNDKPYLTFHFKYRSRGKIAIP